MNNGSFSNSEVLAEDLTWREQEVLILLADRCTNREIADQLHLAESTVKDYVGKILSKLYVKNRHQAVERALDLGLLEPDRKTELGPLTILPAEATPFIGRMDELDEIKRHLDQTRLLTLTGLGGIGKTRLALKTAHQAAGDFEDGVFFVSLAPISSVDHLIQTIAEALKFPLATHEDPQNQLLRYLQRKQILLIMDNFEHLLEGVGIVSKILPAAPEVKVLATSREKLNLRSETILVIGGMSFPDPERSQNPFANDALTLFVQSAAKVCPGFEPSTTELVKISNICEIVQGMPLAIELAAAWLQILNVDEITGELEKGFDILATELRDAPERHKSIRAVFNHSWSLLQRTEQEIFMQLSVFRGGFTRQDAQQVTGTSLQLLMGLVNKSFLSHDPDSGRFVVHELLRQYAQERLGKTPQASRAAEEAHSAYYADFMEERWQLLKGERQLPALAEIEADLENVRAAWRYYLDPINSPQIWKFIYCLWLVYWIRGWNLAGTELFAEAVRVQTGENVEQDAALMALAMAFQGYFMAWLDLSEQGYKLAKDGVEFLQRLAYPEALLLALNSLIVNIYFLNRKAEHLETTQKMFNVSKQIDDEWLLAYTLFAVSMAALVDEDYFEAERQAEIHLKLCENGGDSIFSTLPLMVLGHSTFARGKYEKAWVFYQRCLTISQQTGFHYTIQNSTKYLGKVGLSLDKIEEAEQYLLQSLTMTKEIGFVRDVINLYYEFARLMVAHDKPLQAVELLVFVIQHPVSTQTRMMEGRIRDSAQNLLAILEQELPQDDYSAAILRGQDLELDQIFNALVSPVHSK